MPELPEVERGRRLAASVATGRAIVRARCARDDIVYAGVPSRRFQRALTGKHVVAVHRWGKQLWFELDRSPHPLFHFGMAGSFRAPGDHPLQLMAGPREERTAWPPRFTKIALTFDDGSKLAMTDARRLGRILLRDAPRDEPPIRDLGFDPLLALPPLREFARELLARHAIVKSLLLDQGFAAGVGNWIADEVLYQAGIDPRRRASSLDRTEARRLHAALARVVSRAVAVDADNERYPKHWLFHHRWGRRTGAATSRGEPIEHVTIGGRTTAWVPSAQS